ncbi:helix-turn-helix domain-containing protein [Mycolicibacter virginiensis]|uniref:helix-turn-helix domain-containing protein n=1 Tax=Mycolicibacter virginiensis TaxID=1795032 RepID=UPI001F03FE14|nr:helix-turn-helix domain-containing protein [Mycolicibacter virginiensis]ULP45906.1 helix-turn-helix transcriptional regulator [Mycolicibacter virginiensis]
MTTPFTAEELVTVHRRAVEQLARTDQRRAAAAAAEAGKSPAQIAEQLGVDEPAVERLLRDAAFLGVEVTPEEMITRVWLTGSPREQLIQALIEFPHTADEFAPYPFDGMKRGSWSDVEYGYRLGRLTESEFNRIKAAVDPPRPDDSYLVHLVLDGAAKRLTAALTRRDGPDAAAAVCTIRDRVRTASQTSIAAQKALTKELAAELAAERPPPPIRRFLNRLDVLAEAVREGREKLKLSQAQLAHKAGVEQQFVADVEAGRRCAATELEQLLDVLETLGIHATALPAPRVTRTFADVDLDDYLRRHR